MYSCSIPLCLPLLRLTAAAASAAASQYFPGSESTQVFFSSPYQLLPISVTESGGRIVGKEEKEKALRRRFFSYAQPVVQANYRTRTELPAWLKFRPVPKSERKSIPRLLRGFLVRYCKVNILRHLCATFFYIKFWSFLGSYKVGKGQNSRDKKRRHSI